MTRCGCTKKVELRFCRSLSCANARSSSVPAVSNRLQVRSSSAPVTLSPVEPVSSPVQARAPWGEALFHIARRSHSRGTWPPVAWQSDTQRGGIA